jgi:hypothetical protein
MTKEAPSLVPGRRGKPSVIDCLARILHNHQDSSERPLTFEELTKRVSEMRDEPIAEASVRSIIYRRAVWFERTWGDDGCLRWKLSPAAKKLLQSQGKARSASSEGKGKSIAKNMH